MAALGGVPLPRATRACADYDRYEGHRKSQGFETKLRETTDAKIDQLLADTGRSLVAVELNYLSDATETLIDCRRLLTNTYPFAFYMEKGVEKALLEELQQRLEGVTERLSGALEQEDPDRDAIVNFAADARLRKRHMLEGLEEARHPPTPAGVC